MRFEFWRRLLNQECEGTPHFCGDSGAAGAGLGRVVRRGALAGMDGEHEERPAIRRRSAGGGKPGARGAAQTAAVRMGGHRIRCEPQLHLGQPESGLARRGRPHPGGARERKPRHVDAAVFGVARAADGAADPRTQRTVHGDGSGGAEAAERASWSGPLIASFLA